MSCATTRWSCLVVGLPAGAQPDAVDSLGALLVSLGAAGLEEGEDRLLAYFPDDADLDLRMPAAASHAARLLGPGATVERRPVPAVDWVETWKREVRATEVAPGIVVAPTWDPYEARGGEVVIRLDPGMAFGTGSHASTRLCLAALAAHPPRGQAVLDLGTGSGILAIAAVRLGAARVLAADIDPVATAAAAENVALNGVGSAVEVVTGDLAACEGTFDLVLANILAVPLVQMAEGIAARVRAVQIPGYAGGRAVLSGLLVSEAEAVAAAYGASGLGARSRLVETDASGLGWAALVLGRD
jgi:ribosomal protein L11 methyltransferase